MSTTTNINDPAGVAALLDQLKASPQWQEIAGAITDQPPPEERINSSKPETPSNESVASLLSQLEFPASRSGPNISALVTQTAVESKDNPRYISFRAALPILSELAERGSFLSGVKKIKEDQNSLERELWAEREAIYSKYDEKFKTAQTKARMIGTTVSQYEIDTMTDAFKKELHNFDNGRAIPTWDGLLCRQQQELERMEVPAMFHTTVAQDRERQQQIIEVLESIAGLRTIR